MNAPKISQVSDNEEPDLISPEPITEDNFIMGDNIECPTNIDTEVGPTKKQKIPDPRTISNKFKAAALSAGIHLLPFIQAVVGNQSHSHSQDQIPEIVSENSEERQETKTESIEAEDSVLSVFARTFPSHSQEIERLALRNNFQIANPLTFENYAELLRLVYNEKGVEFFDENINPGYFYLMHEHLISEIGRSDLNAAALDLQLRQETALAIRNGRMSLADAVTQHFPLDNLSDRLRAQLINEAQMTPEERVEFYTNALTGTYLEAEDNISTILSRFNTGNCVARFKYKHSINSINSNKEYFLLIYGPVHDRAYGHIALGHLEEDGVIRPVTGAAGEIERPNIYRASDLIHDLIGAPVDLVQQGETLPPENISSTLAAISDSENSNQQSSNENTENTETENLDDNADDSQLTAAGRFMGANNNGGTDDDTEFRERQYQDIVRRVQNGELNSTEMHRVYIRLVIDEIESLIDHVNLPLETTLNSQLVSNVDSDGVNFVAARSLQQYLRSLPETQAMFQRIFQYQIDFGVINIDHYTSADSLIAIELSLDHLVNFDPRILAENNREIIREYIGSNPYQLLTVSTIERLINHDIVPNFSYYIADNFSYLTEESQRRLSEQDELFLLFDKNTSQPDIDRLVLLFNSKYNHSTDYSCLYATENQYLIDSYLSRDEFYPLYTNRVESSLYLQSIINGEVPTQEAIEFLLTNSRFSIRFINSNDERLFYSVLPRLIQESGIDLLDPLVYQNTRLENIFYATAPGQLAYELGIFSLNNPNLYLMEYRQRMSSIRSEYANADTILLENLFGKSDFIDEIRAELVRRGIEFDPVIRQPIPAPTQ